jgi:hypothetical protein
MPRTVIFISFDLALIMAVGHSRISLGCPMP